MSDLTDLTAGTNSVIRHGKVGDPAETTFALTVPSDPSFYDAQLTIQGSPGVIQLSFEHDPSTDTIHAHYGPNLDRSDSTQWDPEVELYVVPGEILYLWPTHKDDHTHPYGESPICDGNTATWESLGPKAGQATITVRVLDSFYAAARSDGQLQITGAADSADVQATLHSAPRGAAIQQQDPAGNWTTLNLPIDDPQTLAPPLSPFTSIVLRAIDASGNPSTQCVQVNSPESEPQYSPANARDSFACAQFEFTVPGSSQKVVLVVEEQNIDVMP